MSELQMPYSDVFDGSRGRDLRNALALQAERFGLSLQEFLNRVSTGSGFFVDGGVQSARGSICGIDGVSGSGPNQPIDVESLQRICNAQLREAIEDPVAHAKSLGELSRYPGVREMTVEDARDLWDS